MPQTHRLSKRMFWHKIRLAKNCPRHHRYETIEYDHPYRKSVAHVIKVVWRWGVVVGRWEEERLTMVAAALRAARAHEVDPADIPEVQERARNYGWQVIIAPKYVGYDGDEPEPDTANMAAVS